MNQLSNVYGTYPLNNQIIFFDGHHSHFDERALRHMEYQNIQPFILKSGDSTKYHSNDNLPNTKLKSCYNEVKSMWMLKNGKTNCLTHHMKYLVIKAYGAFKIPAGNIIWDIFVKTKLPPLRPPILTINTQECASSIHISSGYEAENQQDITLQSCTY